MPTLTLVQALRKVFDFPEGAQQCMREYKALTDADKEWYAKELSKHLGEEVTVPTPKA